MKHKIVTALVAAAACISLATAGLVAGQDHTSHPAAIQNPCQTTYYPNIGGPGYYKVWMTCTSGPQHNAFRAVAYCNTGTRYGNWQTQPGPWNGSTATCPGGQHLTGAGIQFA